MTVKQLIAYLKIREKQNPDMPVLVASDEEWNSIFGGVELETCMVETVGESVVLFGLSGTEVNI